MTVGKCSIIPKPKKLEQQHGLFVFGKTGEDLSLKANISAKKEGLTNEGLLLFKNKLEDLCGGEVSFDKTGQSSSQITISEGPEFNQKGAYNLYIEPDKINLKANDQQGFFYGFQTLIQLIKEENTSIVAPLVKVEDAPDINSRGLFIEDKWGTDLMTLDDWKELIDYLASIKMNFMGVGLYGCWCVQYENRVTEFSYLKIDDMPEFKTPKNIMYYSPSKKQWVKKDYLPEIYDKDIFGDIVAYGKSKNVTVCPFFNTLGHNTLLPRLYPELSAKDKDGNPTKSGFCTSSDKVYEVLFKIFDQIIDNYLKPSGIDWFCMELDEVGAYIAQSADDVFAKPDPWCSCEECSKKTKEELFIDHIVKMAKYLKSKGMNNIKVYHDQLQRMDMINEKLTERFKQEGLKDEIVLVWWKYSLQAFDTIRPELDLRRFIMPMTGYYAWTLSDEYFTNINEMLKVAHRDKAEGVEAYCTYDPSYDRSICMLADMGWNEQSAGDIKAYEDRYNAVRFPGSEGIAKTAFDAYKKIMAKESKIGNLVFKTLNYYWYSYVRENKDYPRNYPGEAVGELLKDKDNSIKALKDVKNYAKSAIVSFKELLNKGYDVELIEHFIFECMHYKQIAEEFIAIVDLGDTYNKILDVDKAEQLNVIDILIEKLNYVSGKRDKVILYAERVRKEYWKPSLIRNMSIYRQMIKDILQFLSDVKTGLSHDDDYKLQKLDITDMRGIAGKMFMKLRTGRF